MITGEKFGVSGVQGLLFKVMNLQKKVGLKSAAIMSLVGEFPHEQKTISYVYWGLQEL